MFDKQFYPTPVRVVYQMIAELDLNGKTVLEPSAGKGDIVKVLKESGAKVVICEKNEDLALISSKKADVFIKHDFLQVTSDEISHVHFIIMNPPFLFADKHILHAYEIAPEGCVIVALCNYETVSNKYSRNRDRLGKLVAKYGTSENIGDVFSTAERTTEIDIGLIKLYKPKTGANEFDDFMFSEEEEEQYFGASGLVQYSKIRDIVGRYIQGVQMFDTVIGTASAINDTIKPLGGSFRLSFSAIEHRDDGFSELTREEYKKRLQKSAWRSVFREMKMEKYLTQSAKEQINKFVEQQTNKPFTMKNIFKMAELIVGTHEGRMQKVIEEVFDWLTEHHHDNRQGVEGWKTNSMYFVGMKFIAPYCGLQKGWSGQPTFSYSDRAERMEDLIKALCMVTGKNYNDMIPLIDFFREDTRGEKGYKEWGTWYDWNFFQIKVGTMHVKFKDKQVWEMFNRAACKAKGWQIPERTGSDFKRKKEGVEVYG